MRSKCTLLMLALLASTAIPAAHAGSTPVIYFLKDGELGPAGDGILNNTAPDSLEPSVRPVVFGTADLPTAVFATPEAAPAPMIWGPVFVGLWLGPSAVADGNITTVVYETTPDGTRTAIASASQEIDFNQSSVPEPTTFVPPNATDDPEGAVTYVTARALMALLQPPALLSLGFLDQLQFTEGNTVSLGFFLEAGEGNPSPVPVGTTATVQYDGQLMPTFLYIPWYTEDEPSPSETETESATETETETGSSGPGSTTPTETQTDGPSGSSDKKDSPGLGFIALLAALGAVLALRRRL